MNWEQGFESSYQMSEVWFGILLPLPYTLAIFPVHEHMTHSSSGPFRLILMMTNEFRMKTPISTNGFPGTTWTGQLRISLHPVEREHRQPHWFITNMKQAQDLSK